MSKFLLSAAAAALMTAPALAQSDRAESSQQSDAAQERQSARGQSDTARPAQSQGGENAAARGAGQSERAQAAAQDEQFDWDTDHDWVDAAVYGEDGDQIGVVDRVRMRASGGDQVRALVLNTDGFLDQGMRHIRLLGDEATVITQDALPRGWSVSRTGSGTSSDGSGGSQEEGDEERRWWNWGRDDEGGQDDAAQASANSGMTNFTLITLDFSNDEIGMMPEYTAPASAGLASAGASADAETSITSDTTEGGSMTAGESQRADSRQATQQAAQTAQQEATGEQAMAANAGQTGDPMGENSGQAMSDEDSEAFQSEYGNEIGEDASDGYDRAVRAGRENVGGENDTGVNMQNGDAPDDIADSTLMDDGEGQTGMTAGQDTAQSGATSDMTAEDMNAGSTDMQRANRGGQAGDAADADNGAMTARDSQSGQAWADDDSPADSLTRQGMENGGDSGQTVSGQDSSAASGAQTGADTGAMSGETGQTAGGQGGSDAWTEDNTLVGQDVYAQDDTRLGSVGRVQQDGAGTQAEPIALIIVTDTMGEREVSLQDRTWSNDSRQGEDSLTLDYQDQSEFEQDSAPYGEDGRTGAVGGQDGQYETEGGEDTGDSDQWTDDHAWVDTAVYSRTGSQIGEIERVRGGSTGGQPTAIVIETNGFLDIGGREVELNGSNFRLTDYEGEEVLQIRYTEDEVDQMTAFNEANVSDYPLSDNPLESDESEPMEDETR